MTLIKTRSYRYQFKEVQAVKMACGKDSVVKAFTNKLHI